MEKTRIYGLITGQSETGKSYFVKNYIIPILAKSKPVFIFDILNEYAGGGAKDVPGKWDYYADFQDFLKHVEENGGISKKIHVIAWKTDETIIEAIHFFRKLEKPVSLVFEEMHALFSDTDLKKACGKQLKEITFYGRHFGIDCILITQRPKSLSTDVRSQVPFCISFRQSLKSDIDSLEEIDDSAGSHVVDLKPRFFYTFGELPKAFDKLQTNKVQKL